MRPAKLSRDPGYGLSDPGAEYVENVLGCWLGPLAKRLGVEGKEATLEGRTNVYKGLDPSGRVRLFHIERPKSFRPVIGGNVFAPKSLCGQLAFASDKTRREVERAYAEEVKATVLEKVLPDLMARAKKAGKELRPAELMCFIDKHTTDSAGHYNLHFQVSIVARGRCDDAVFRSLDNSPLFEKQWVYALDTDSRIAPRLLHEQGITLKPGPKGTLEVDGLEDFRRVETPMRARILKALKDAGRKVTPKTIHFEALRQRGAKKVRVATATALANTREWVRKAGINVRKAVVRPVPKPNELMKQKAAEFAVWRAKRLVDKIGVPVTRSEFELLAKSEGTRVFASPARVDARVAEVFRHPLEHGLFPAGPGRVTTDGIETARRKADAAVTKMAKRRGRRPSRRAVASLSLGPTPVPAHQIAAAVRQFTRRATRLDAPTPALGHFVRAHQLDGRRVITAGTPRTAAEFARAVDRSPEHPDVIAARLDKPGKWKSFLRLRSVRWKSFDHFVEVAKASRRPDLVLTRDDVVVLDARYASQRAVATICRAAKKARATLVVINNPADTPDLTRHRTRGHTR
jgi:hypothetical protein